MADAAKADRRAPPLAAARRVAGFIAYVGRRAVADQVFLVAGDLGYVSLIGIVPMFAIGAAMLAAVPAFEGARAWLEQFIFLNFVPSFGQQVLDTVGRFVDASAGLTLMGVAGLAFIAILLLVTIEHAFNHIFRVTRARPPLARLAVYWIVLTVGPLLVGASFSLSTWIQAHDEMGLRLLLDRLGGPVAYVMPYLLSATAFVLLYVAVPNRRVRVKDALVGAGVAALLFAALRFGFVLYVAQAHNYFTLYGALAALPLFLTWLYASWSVVLLGAVVTAALPEWRLQRAQIAGQPPATTRLVLALDVIGFLLAEQRTGPQGARRLHILAATGAPEAAFTEVMEALESCGLIARTDRQRWVVARDLRTTTLGDLIHALGLGLPADLPSDLSRPWRDKLAHTLRTLHDTERWALATPLSDILTTP